MEKNILLYRNPNHTANLNNMRLNNKLCDVTIRVNGVEFRVHKVVLAANLKYFDTMFLNDTFQESKQDVITMESVKEEDFEAFVNYCYTGEILLTDSNALNLLITADYLSDNGIRDACIQFLLKHLKAEEACRAYKFANNINCISLKNVAKTTILSNVVHCSQTVDYLNFDYKHLADIFSDGKAQPAQLQQKFVEGIIKWIVHDVKERRIRMEDLFGSVDMTKVTSDNLIEYLYGNMVDYNDEYGIIRDIMFCYQSSKSQQMKSPIFNAEQILAVADFGVGKLQLCNLTHQKWSKLEEIPVVSSSEEVSIDFCIALNNKLYYTTEEESQEEYLCVFDLVTKRMTRLNSIGCFLNYRAACACDRYLYLCGGRYKNESKSNKVLKYDPLTKSLETLTPMGTERSDPAAIFYQGYLHVLGGLNSSDDEVDSVEKYDPDIKKWTAFPSMCKARYGHGVAVLDGKLYACGGLDSYSVEVYDPSKNCWQLIANMNKERWLFILVAHEGKLWAIGGDNDEKITVEVYHPSTDEWKMHHELSSGLQIRCPKGGLISSNCFANVN